MLRNDALFEQDPFLLVARGQPFWIGCLVSSPVWGFVSTRFKRIKEPLGVAFLVCSGGVVGFATLQPDDDTTSLIFAGLAGVGFGGLLILIIAGVQLATPHHLIATATAVTVSSRAIAASVFTAVYVAAYSDRIKRKLPSYIAAAALKAGLPESSLQAFADALVGNDQATLLHIQGVTPAVIAAAGEALKQSYADSIRIVFIIAAPFGVVAAISCWFLADMKKTMNYTVDAPLEELKSKIPHKHIHHNTSA